MLGGGVFVTQNKILPGSYINFVNASKVTTTLGDRGTVAIALPINYAAGTVIEVTRAEFAKNTQTLLGKSYDSDEVAPLREIFCHATKVYLYDLGENGTVSEAVAALEPYDFNVLCAYTGTAEDASAYVTQAKSWRDDMGKKCQVVVYNQSAPDHEGVINVVSTVSDEDVNMMRELELCSTTDNGIWLASRTMSTYQGKYYFGVNSSM